MSSNSMPQGLLSPEREGDFLPDGVVVLEQFHALHGKAALVRVSEFLLATLAARSPFFIEGGVVGKAAKSTMAANIITQMP